MSAKKDMQEVEAKPRKDAELMQDRPVFTPETDIFETKDAITLLMNVPGVDEKALEISLENDALKVVAPQGASEPQDMQLQHRGYATGVYRRSFSIVADVDKSKIKAKLSNGVLRLTLPKCEKAKPQRISVELE